MKAQNSTSTKEHLFYSFLWFPLNFQSVSLFAIVLPTETLILLKSQNFGNLSQANFVGIVSIITAIIALFVTPIAGYFSDKSFSSFGRRRPYIIGGAIIMLLSMIFLIPTFFIIGVVLGYVFLQIGTSITTAAYQGIIPDVIPKTERGTASGFLGAMTMLGSALGLGITALFFSFNTNNANYQEVIKHGVVLYFSLCAILLIVGTLITAFKIKEKQWQYSKKRTKKELFFIPWQSHNFRWLIISRALLWLSLSLFSTYIEFYFAAVAKSTNFIGETALLAFIALLSAIIGALFAGKLSNKHTKPILVAWASIIMGIAVMPFVVLPANTFPLWILGILFGFGYGSYLSVDWALAIDTLPSLDDAAKDLGIWGLASNLPAIAAPLIGVIILNTSKLFTSLDNSYRIIFFIAAMIFFISAMAVRNIIPVKQTYYTEKQTVENL